MKSIKCCVFVALLVASASARPQGFDDLDALGNAPGDMFDPNPKYSYTYQVASDEEQTYIAHQENRDGANVNGEYSYVDPLGQLITVTYTAGPDGYQENRAVQENFVSIRERPVKTTTTISGGSSGISGGSGSSGIISTVVEQVRPAVQTVVSQTSSAGASDSDLVARIIAQLTPFIRDTVSSSLSGSASGSSTQTTRTVQTVQQPVQTVQTVQALPVVAPVVSTQRVASNAVSSVFGTGGANNVRFETPEFNFAYQLE